MTINYEEFWKQESFTKQLKERDRRRRLLLESEETIKLFNPFHDTLGRFASRSGGGGAGQQVTGQGSVATTSGSKLIDVKTKDEVVGKLKKSKAGSILKVGAGLLGIGVLGAVGLAILTDDRENEGMITIGGGDSLQDLIDKGLIDPSTIEQHKESTSEVHGHPHVGIIDLPEEDVQKTLSDISGQLPRFNSVEEAQSYISSEFDKMGVEINDAILNDIFKTGPNANAAGDYHPLLNDMRLTPEIIEGIKNGDPSSISVLIHELGHSAQDAGGGMLDELNMGYMDIRESNENFISHYVEGQNELLTRVMMSRMTGATEGYWSYENETRTMAGVYKALSQRTGEDAIQTLITTHSQGFVAPIQYDQVIREVFPNRVEAPVITPNGIIYPSFPSIQEMEQWLREDYGIESEAALQEILDQAVSQ